MLSTRAPNRVWYSPVNLLEVPCACDFSVFRCGGGFVVLQRGGRPDGSSGASAEAIAELDCVASGLAEGEDGGCCERRCTDGGAVRRNQRAGWQAARLGPLPLTVSAGWAAGRGPACGDGCGWKACAWG